MNGVSDVRRPVSLIAGVLVVSLLSTVLAACSPLGLVNGAASFYPADVRRDIRYGDNPKQALDLYLPRQQRLTPGQSTPVVVFFYGGSWNSGDKSMYGFIGRRMAAAGFITVVANYRLYPDVVYPDFLSDSAKAVRKVHELMASAEFADWRPAQKLFLMGHSAGAYNISMLALDQRWLAAEGLDRDALLQGWIGLAGPYDLYPITIEEVKPVFHHPHYPAHSNPIEFASESVIPALIVAPEDDETIRTEIHSYALAERFREQGADYQLVTLPKTGHVTLIGSFSPLLLFTPSAMEPVEAFIRARAPLSPSL